MFEFVPVPVVMLQRAHHERMCVLHHHGIHLIACSVTLPSEGSLEGDLCRMHAQTELYGQSVEAMAKTFAIGEEKI